MRRQGLEHNDGDWKDIGKEREVAPELKHLEGLCTSIMER